MKFKIVQENRVCLLPKFCSLQSSLNGSASNVPDGAGRSFATSFSGQSGAASPVFHHSGGCMFLEFLYFYSNL